AAAVRRRDRSSPENRWPRPRGRLRTREATWPAGPFSSPRPRRGGRHCEAARGGRPQTDRERPSWHERSGFRPCRGIQSRSVHAGRCRMIARRLRAAWVAVAAAALIFGLSLISGGRLAGITAVFGSTAIALVVLAHLGVLVALAGPLVALRRRRRARPR